MYAQVRRPAFLCNYKSCGAQVAYEMLYFLRIYFDVCLCSARKQTAFLLVKIMLIDYYAQLSGLRKYNSGAKTAFALLNLCIVIAVNKITLSLFVMAFMSLATLLKGKTPLKVYAKLMSIPLTFIALSCIMIGVEFSFRPLGKYFISLHFIYAGVTKKSALTSLGVFFKVMAGISSLYLLSLSTPVNEIVMVLEKLRLPKLFTELMHLIYRYIFILFDTALRLQTSAKARLGFCGFGTSCKSFAMVAGSLFISALKKSQAYYDALLSRGYDGRLEFLSEEYPLKVSHILSAAIYFAVIFLIAKAGV